MGGMNKLNPWFSQIDYYDDDAQHALTGFFSKSNPYADAVVIWPEPQIRQFSKASKRFTLKIRNSTPIVYDDPNDPDYLQFRRSYEKLEVVPKVLEITPTAGTSASAGTLTLNAALGDIFTIDSDTTLSNTSKPYTIVVTNLNHDDCLGKSVVLKVNLATGIRLKFGNNIIIDTTDGADYDAGTYCITFANVDAAYRDQETKRVIQVISLWKAPGYTNQ